MRNCPIEQLNGFLPRYMLYHVEYRREVGPVRNAVPYQEFRFARRYWLFELYLYRLEYHHVPYYMYIFVDFLYSTFSFRGWKSGSSGPPVPESM